MSSLQNFKKIALSNTMEVEHIIEEIYTELAEGLTGFTCLDGGAHHGHHTTRLANLPGCKRVLAVEADPIMVQKLYASLEHFGLMDSRVQVVEAALQRDPSVTSIRWNSSSSHEGRSSILSENAVQPSIWSHNKDMEYRDASTVAATTIDKVLDGTVGPVNFIKLDLEGADLIALLGARETLLGKRPLVAFENSIHAPKVHNFTLDEIAGYFYGIGYAPMSFVGEPLSRSNWFGFFEAWAAPIERVDWLAARLQTALLRRGIYSQV